MVIDDRRSDDLTQPGAESGLVGIVIKPDDPLADANQNLLNDVGCIRFLQPVSDRNAADDTAIDLDKLLPCLAITVITQPYQDTRSCFWSIQNQSGGRRGIANQQITRREFGDLSADGKILGLKRQNDTGQNDGVTG